MSHDLRIERTLKASRKAIWRCWTETDLLKQWFCPKPWGVEHAEFDLRPGGHSMVVMKGPNGERFENPGCWLEVVPMERLTFTDAFTAGFVPTDKPFMVGYVELADAPGGGTKYVAGARHWTEEARKQHEAMGFHEGWGKATEQLEELALGLR
ncbi:MAG: SRPBCC family protein [Rhodospirillales bacterium]|nr:SRPBCC family protein [Rhodospirillales bacterium]